MLRICTLTCITWFLMCFGGRLLAESKSNGGVDFNRDVLPILSDKCFKCHGPDGNSREADLRLDVREEAITEHATGKPIVPGNVELSQIITRMESTVSEERMPPSDSGLLLIPKEIEILKQWIQEGAEYKKHWSFIVPESKELPSEDRESLSEVGIIDRIVRTTLQRKGLRPSPQADRATLLRRATLTLTGLPPTIAEIDAFLGDESPQAYERVVERLLDSQRFGERMALDWLDAARYADTNGYYNDTERQAWPWREWVINAFNRNMPFDQFTIEQIAGDLLPNATTEQRIATGFNRNHMVTNETGIIDEEYRIGYVADRLDTTTTVWLGLTVGCARCHDHKYDPISQRDYYQMFCAFNNIEETGLIKDMAPLSPAPAIMLPSDEQKDRIASLESERKSLESQFKSQRPELEKAMAEWESKGIESNIAASERDCLVHFNFDRDQVNHGQQPVQSTLTGDLKETSGVKGKAAAFESTQYIEFTDPKPMENDKPFSLSVWIMPGSSPQGCVASKMNSNAEARGFEILWYKSQPRINLAHRYGTDGIEVVADQKFSGKQWRHLVITYDGSSKAAGLKIFVDGKLNPSHIRRDNLSGSVASDEPWRIAWKGTGIGFEGGLDEFRIFNRALTSEEVEALHWHEFLHGTIAVSPSERTRQQTDKLEAYYISHFGTKRWQSLSERISKLRSAEETARREILSVSVMQEMEKTRTTHILVRGQYDQPGEEVQFGIPKALGSLPEDAPQNRLGFAQWLVSADNPLTARVAVNRLWAICFGEGLVRTSNDFGLQGEPPVHPELLDVLAVRFRDGHDDVEPWDVKALLKDILMSETFCQSTRFTPELLSIDPENRWLARGPRYRLPAELLRDQVLAIGGLLVERIGGPSVKPYQPPGIWEAVSYNGEATYVVDQGESLYRRGLYTYWKRQAPPPSILAFDGPTREVCSVRRARTNTPLQALALLNDVTYIEAARGLGVRMMKTKVSPIEAGFRMATGRAPRSEEVQSLESYFNEQKAHFTANRDLAHRILRHGASQIDESLDAVELAAWSMTASILLNLDEVLTQH
jgi:hypothetical protein